MTKIFNNKFSKVQNLYIYINNSFNKTNEYDKARK